LQKAAESKTYAEELKVQLFLRFRNHWIINPFKVVAVHPAYDDFFDAFAPKNVHGNLKLGCSTIVCCKASQNLGLNAHNF
jgi:hypothetical protein